MLKDIKFMSPSLLHLLLYHSFASLHVKIKFISQFQEKVYTTVMSYSNETLLNRIQTMYDNNTFFSMSLKMQNLHFSNHGEPYLLQNIGLDSSKVR
ncbi:hypothetical protein [Plasmodium yoelii yoelii]|uniref:Uncharacterized protein n=1 Tax=Plasmodium yoelii yoelii TaxID=73239 RepID=Q7RJW1_PLAYO|nr:hypothetical protein [Plasmodium yoelii yoelii]